MHDFLWCSFSVYVGYWIWMLPYSSSEKNDLLKLILSWYQFPDILVLRVLALLLLKPDLPPRSGSASVCVCYVTISPGLGWILVWFCGLFLVLTIKMRLRSSDARLALGAGRVRNVMCEGCAELTVDIYYPGDKSLYCSFVPHVLIHFTLEKDTLWNILLLLFCSQPFGIIIFFFFAVCFAGDNMIKMKTIGFSYRICFSFSRIKCIVICFSFCHYVKTLYMCWNQ